MFIKKLLTVFALIAICTGIAFADTWASDTNLIYDSNWAVKVGIGTSNPQSALDVNGNIQISNASIPMGLMTEVGGTSPLLNMSVNFREPNKNTTYRGGAFRIDTRDNTPLFQWLTRPAGSTTENQIMVLNESGYLGIGTSSPTSPLMIVGSSSIRSTFSVCSTANSTSIAIQGNAIGANSTNYGVYGQATATTPSSNFGLYGTASGSTSANWAGYFDSGNVYVNNKLGLGSSNPTEKIESIGNIYVNGENSGFIVDAAGLKRVGFMKYGGIEGSFVHGNSAPLRFGRVDQSNVTGGNFTEEMRIGTNGYVGIGTTSPAYRFTVTDYNGYTSIAATDGAVSVGLGTLGHFPNPSDDAGTIGTTTNHSLFVLTNNSIRMMVDASGNVAIGATTANAKLDVAGGNIRIADNSANRGLYFNDGGTASSVYINSGLNINYGSGNPQLIIRSNGTETARFDSSGNLLLGTTTATKKLTVAGDGYFTGVVTTGSSRTLKKDITNLTEDEAVSVLRKLEPVKFKYKADKTETERLGFIAEDVPALVAEKDRKSLNDMNLTALAITVIQQQQKRIEALEKEIEQLKLKK